MPPASPRRWACRRRSRARPWLFLRPVQPRPRKSPAPPACCWPASWRPFRLKPSTGWGGRGEPAGRGQDLRRQGAAVQPSCDRPYRAGRGRVVLGRAGAGRARLLMDAFWPGPLTLILKRAPHIADTVSGRQDSIGLRCPSHPVAQALLAAFAAGKPNGQGGWRRRRPISSGRSRRRWPSTCARNSPTRSRPACRCWKAGVRSGHRIHHPGPVAAGPGRRSRAAASRPCQRRADRGGAGRAGVRARRAAPRSGTLKAHYAPRTELELAGDARVADVLQASACPRARWRWCRSTPRRPRPMPACNGARCRPIRRATRRRCTRCCASWTPRAMPASSCRRRPPTTHGMRSTTASAAAAAFTLDTSDL